MASNATSGSAEPVQGQNGATETTPLLGQGTEVGVEAATHRGYKLRDRCAAIGTYRFVAVALIIAFVIVAALWYKLSTANSTAALCVTPACIDAASGYLTNLSPNYETLDPCDNFEEFVCGGWHESHDMRADQGMTDALGLINDEVTSTIRHILEGGYPHHSGHSGFSPRNLAVATASADAENFEKLKKAYDTCMDVDAIAKAGFTPLLGLLGDLHKALDSSSDYSAATLFLETAGTGSFFNFYVGDDDKDPETQVIAVGPVRSVGLPSKSYFEDKDIVAKYQDAIAKVLGAINLKPFLPNFGPAADAAAALVKFEARISAASPDKADMDDITKTYNVLSIKDTAKLLPQFGLETVFGKLVPSGYKLENTITAFPDVLANVSHIIADTPVDIVHNFFYWRLIVAYSGIILGPEIKPWQQFQNVLQGKDPDAEPERWRTCVGRVGSSLGWILSRFFIEASFSAGAKDFGNQIISDIKSAYVKKFSSLTWMDNDVKKVAAEKVHNIDQKVGYPTASPDIMDPVELGKYYDDLDVTDSLFDNTVSTARFSALRDWSSLGKPTDMNRWEMFASTVNAYYNPTHNEIVFPAAIMQFPLFSVELPSYVSYGAFGAVAGHELSHAFDNNGRHYDIHGKYSNWWTNSTIEAFTEKSQCIVDEFNNFTVIGKDGPIHINGRQTLGENIADSGGISAAWAAWNDRRKVAHDLSLPGLDHFTHEQLFFISFGNAWCSKFRPAMLTNRVTTDEHSPDPVRIKGTVLNSRGFREAFNCPVKEPTCELW